MKSNQLEKTLASLVANYGHRKVQNKLDSMKPGRLYPARRERPDRLAKRTYSGTQTKPARRRDAVTVAESLELNDAEKKTIIVDMAKRYEAKEFMPHVGHVRAFLESLGKDVSRIKSRQQVTVSVFKKLAGMETSALRDIQERGLYGPPITLGPIADAIGRFGRSRRSHQ